MRYATFLVQIKDPNTGNTQISDIIIFKDDLNMYTAERSKVHTTPSELGTLLGQMDTSKNVSLKFTQMTQKIMIMTSKYFRPHLIQI